MKLICMTMLLSLWVSPMVTTPCKTVVRIKRNAMEYACQTQRGPLQKAFGIIQIPDLALKTEGGGGGILGGIVGAGQALLGNVMNLVGIKITNVKLPDLSIKIMPLVGAEMSVNTELRISVNVPVVGAIELAAGAGVQARIRIDKTPKGLPILDIFACQSTVADVQVTVGRFGLLPPVLKALQGHIHAILTQNLCLSFTKVFLGLNADLGLMAAINPIGKDVSMQYTLHNPPVVTGDCIDMDMDAQYTIGKQVVEYPTGAQEFTLPPGAGVQDAMVNVGLSSGFFTSIFVAMQGSGALNCEIPSTHASLANQLTTFALGSYIPEIRRKYSQNLPLYVNIALTRAPILNFHDNKLILQISPTVEISVVSPNSHSQNLLTVLVGASLAVAVDVQGTKLELSVSINGNLNLEITSISFGQCNCNPSLLHGYIHTLFEEAYIVQMNEALRVGVSLPCLPKMKFTHQVFEIKKDYAVMSCDLQKIE